MALGYTNWKKQNPTGTIQQYQKGITPPPAPMPVVKPPTLQTTGSSAINKTISSLQPKPAPSTGIVPNKNVLSPNLSNPTSSPVKPAISSSMVQSSQSLGGYKPPVPRQEPLVATKESPLKTISPNIKDDFSGLSDREKQVQVMLKQSKGENLSDNERQYMINQFLDKQEMKVEDFAPGISDTYNKQITDLQNEYDTTKSTQEKEREKMIAQKKTELDAMYGKRADEVKEAGRNQQSAAGTALSFSGFGRSTFNAEQQTKIQKDIDSQVTAINAAKDLETQLFQRQLEGEDSESLRGITDRINGIKSQAQQFEMNSAMQVAQMNQENKLNFAESFSNLLQTLSPQSQKSINKDVSEMLGFAADEFGQPIFTDEQGNPIPLGKDEEMPEFNKDASEALGFAADKFGRPMFTDDNGEPIPLPKDQEMPAIDTAVSEMLGFAADKFGNPAFSDDEGNPIYANIAKPEEKTTWASYEDKYGNTVFYDKNDPANTYRQPVDSYPLEDGSTASAPTSYTGGVQVVGKGNQYKRDDGSMGYLGENCVKYARTLVPNLPMGLTSKQDKINAIKAAEQKGIGSSNMSLAKVGDAVLTGEGSWGHALVIAGFNDNGNIIVDEANYKTGTVTRGRELSPDDPKIFGFIHNSDSSRINPINIGSGVGEGRTGGVDNQVLGGGGNWSGTQVSEFKKKLSDPNFIPSRVGNYQQEMQFQNEFDNWYAAGGAEKGTTANKKQSQNALAAIGYAKRLEESQKNFDSLYKNINEIGTAKFIALRNTPDFLNGTKPEWFQQMEQSERNFVNAVLRRESGAAISDSEFANAAKQYFPQPGDKPSVIEQKRQNRQIVIDNFFNEGGSASSYVQGSSGGSSSGGIQMKTPDGRTISVPASEVEAMKQYGATVISSGPKKAVPQAGSGVSGFLKSIAGVKTTTKRSSRAKRI